MNWQRGIDLNLLAWYSRIPTHDENVRLPGAAESTDDTTTRVPMKDWNDDGYGHGVQESNVDFDQGGDYDPYQLRVDQYVKRFGYDEEGTQPKPTYQRYQDIQYEDEGYQFGRYEWQFGPYTDETLPNASTNYYYR